MITLLSHDAIDADEAVASGKELEGFASHRSTAAAARTVPVMTPRLPTAEQLLPYLQRIDASRIYTNFGPLVLELESRLCELLELPRDCLVTASSGTAALVGAIMASTGRANARRPLALMPGYTFVATAVAAEQCGFRPYLCDIDLNTWMLDPEQLIAHPALDQVGVVIPVSAYGIGVPQTPWLAFQERTGIPVVIDGAASFEAVCSDPYKFVGDVPVVMSFHATKGFATGEGGAVVCTDIDLVNRVARALNFGFQASRESLSPSINGKLSEYHAAIGLAELDGWHAKRLAFANVAATYRQAFGISGLNRRLVVSPDICSSYALFCCSHPEQAEEVQRVLQREAIDFRLWYGSGLHRHGYFAGSPRGRLTVTDYLAPCVIGLPMAPDLGFDVIHRVASAVMEGISIAP
jgi:dTDP-4-amino-4,6-dideoxygalactose transaminase